MRSAAIFLMGIVITSPGMALEATLVTCDHPRYYEGEVVACHVNRSLNSATATVAWSIFGMDLQKKTIRFGDTPPVVELISPQGLKAVTPLRLQIDYKDPTGKKTVQSVQAQVQLFPRSPSYWTGPNEFTGKIIAVDSLAEWITRDLDALNIPYVKIGGKDLLKLKKVDWTITQNDLKEYNLEDPWKRWELVQMIRKHLEPAEPEKEKMSEKSEKLH